MPSWFFYAVGAMIALGSADFFVKLASGKVSNSIAIFIFGICTFLFGLGWVAWQRFQGIPQHAEPLGLLAGTAVGIAFSLVTAGLYATFSAGAPISLASPFIRLGGLLLASMAGLILFREPLTWRYVLGAILAVSGLYLIITR